MDSGAGIYTDGSLVLELQREETSPEPFQFMAYLACRAHILQNVCCMKWPVSLSSLHFSSKMQKRLRAQSPVDRSLWRERISLLKQSFATQLPELFVYATRGSDSLRVD